MTRMKYVPKHFWKEHLRALQVFLCALISRPVCTRAQLRAGVRNLFLSAGHMKGSLCSSRPPIDWLLGY